MYSNGESEVILGKAIKKLNLPRDEIVVMTKVRVCELVNVSFLIGSRSTMSSVALQARRYSSLRFTRTSWDTLTNAG